MRQQRRLARKQPSNVLRAAALFAVLCGAVAFAGSFRAADEPAAAATDHSDLMRQRLSRALNHLESATHALDAENYGRTRFLLQETRQELSAAIETP